MVNNLFNMTNDELREFFSKQIMCQDVDNEYHRRCEERRRNIQRDFDTEWSKQRFKWLFKKRRQNKLRRAIEMRYPGPVFWLIEDIINETLVDTYENEEFFGQLVDIKEN